jgi:simple sugar transport system permease protein
MILRRAGYTIAAPLASLVIGFGIAAIILAVSGNNPWTAYSTMFDAATHLEVQIDIVNRAIPLYIAGVAAAIGFRMNLFNIGVEGQYIVAALMAAKVGAEIELWAPLHLTVIILAAMGAGAVWALIPAILAVTRNVHIVISTIMLNAIGVGFVVGFLLPRWDEPDPGLNTETKEISPSGRFPDLNKIVEVVTRDISGGRVLYGFLIVAIVVGVLYHLYVTRTTSGFDLRASGMNPLAAEVSGAPESRMVVQTMLLSGAVAGLIGLTEILGRDYGRRGADFRLPRLDRTLAAIRSRCTVGDHRDHAGDHRSGRRHRLRGRAPPARGRRDEPRRSRAGRHAGFGRGTDMTVTSPPPTAAVPEPASRGRRTLSRPILWMLFATAGLLLIAITEEVASPTTNQLASSGTWSTALGYSVPILMAGLGGLWCERSGIVNIGLEGMLVIGTWCGAYGAYEFGPWGGIALGIFGGAVFGYIHGVATVTFGVNHIISGVAINLMAPGVTRFLAGEIFRDFPGGSISQSPSVGSVKSFDVPLLSGGLDGPDALGRIESWDWFLVSTAAGIAKGFTSNLSWLTVIAFAFVPLTVFILWRTAFGLRLRSCGEHPIAADSLGVNVYKYKYYACVVSGALAGFGGAFLAIELTGIYKQNQVNGRGFIGLATMIFGNWRPVGTMMGGLLFGFTDVLQLRDRPAQHALLLVLCLGLAGGAAWMLWQRRRRIAGGLGVASAGFLIWYLATDNIPKQLSPVIPNIAVLVVLVFYAKRLRMPKADGIEYRRGDQ